MAIDSERHGGLWDVPETALADASRGWDAAHAAVAQSILGASPPRPLTRASCSSAFSRPSVCSPVGEPPWAAYAGSQPNGPERR